MLTFRVSVEKAAFFGQRFSGMAGHLMLSCHLHDLESYFGHTKSHRRIQLAGINVVKRCGAK